MPNDSKKVDRISDQAAETADKLTAKPIRELSDDEIGQVAGGMEAYSGTTLDD